MAVVVTILLRGGRSTNDEPVLASSRPSGLVNIAGPGRLAGSPRIYVRSALPDDEARVATFGAVANHVYLARLRTPSLNGADGSGYPPCSRRAALLLSLEAAKCHRQRRSVLVSAGPGSTRS